MPQALILQINNEIIQKLFGYRVGEYITIIIFRKVVYMLNYCIIDGCIMFRLSPAALFKYFPDEVSKIDTF